MARLCFDKSGDTGKTGIWNVAIGVGTGYEILGEVRWYAPWRRYTFFPADRMLFDVACLEEIVAFIKSEMAKRK
jgi:hypothetical protein